ncbi:MerR family transcriptional regulator [Ferrimonas sp. YFM]|uniref:MerR family transcriptional regulator n=1 Tax=Ferrimonas sp. YFM TaxID=3028878 RepID=UPI0025744B3F|nr:MerR family transcriptional regulator [Ferrimonas sp. YFM]BDY06293.1 methyltransferase [Ferrimonas sp. YFM]
MYPISQLAKRAGLARSTLLYYEKLGLLTGRRGDNGYRYYDDRDLQRLRLIQQLHAGNLSLRECKQILESGLDRQLLADRLAQLEEEIRAKTQARNLMQALLGDNPEGLRQFHQQLETQAPDAHTQWLRAEGLDETNALRLRWLSRDLYGHEEYMNDFLEIFNGLDRHGPGTDHSTLWALSQVSPAPRRILDIGCGTGASAVLLAQHSQAQVIGLDNLEPSLNHMLTRARQLGLEQRLSACNGSMTALPFEPGSFDLLWSEASCYIIGFENALKQWRPLLERGGYLVISDLVWLDEFADAQQLGRDDLEVKAFWQEGYPDMQRASTRLMQVENSGYRPVAHRGVGTAGWQAYTAPLRERLQNLSEKLADSPAVADLERELTILDRSEGRFDYQLMVLKRTD